MEHPDDTHKRLTDLEIKASFTEDLLDQLEQVIVRQQRHIDWLLQEMAQLRQAGTANGANLSGNLRDELPPHF